MSRRGRSDSPITLFSLQDIITCVTGIMLLLTLLLAVEWLSRKDNRANASTGESARELQDSLVEARLEIARLQKVVHAGAPIVARQAALTPSDEAAETDRIREQIQRLEEERGQLERSAAELRQEIQRHKAALANDEQNQRKRTDSERREQSQQEERKAALEAELRSVQAELEQLRSKNRLIYNAAPGAAKRAWLIDISDGQYVVAPARLNGDEPRSEAPRTFSNQWSLLRFTGGLNTATDYFVLLVRPAGVANLDSLRKSLEQQGFDLGFDVIGADHTVIEPAQEVPAP